MAEENINHVYDAQNGKVRTRHLPTGLIEYDLLSRDGKVYDTTIYASEAVAVM